MATTLNFKPILDKPDWRPVATPQSGLTPNGAGSSPVTFAAAVSDFRSNNYNTPKLWYMGNTAVNTHLEYNSVTDAWSGIYNSSWGSGGTAGTGMVAALAPSQGPRGGILAGSTTSAINLDTTYYAPVAATWTRAASTITVTTTRDHNFYTGQRVYVSVTSDATAVPLSTIVSPYTITVLSSTTFSFTGGASGGAAGTLTVGIPIMADQWANRGDGQGFMIRIIGLTSGKTEERRVVSNTGYSTPSSLYVTAPTIYLDQPLSFTPAAGDRFELLSGTILTGFTGAATAGQWRSFDVSMLINADNVYAQSGSRGVTNLSLSTSAQGGIVVFDEQHVPVDRLPGEGFVVGLSTYDTATLTGTTYINTKKCLLATAIAAGSITGQATNGDASVVANEFRNFQIRIVEDTVNTTAVGQRRRISSHTAGPSAVYTLSANWSVTPSANAKFVIENWTDNVLVTSGATSAMYTYKISNLCADTSQTIDTWSTTQLTSTGSPGHYGFLVHSFGNKRENSSNNSIRNSLIYSLSSGSLYVFDIAGGTNGAWTASNMYRLISAYLANSSSTLLMAYAYDPNSKDGDAVYIFNQNVASTQTNIPIFRLNLISGLLSGYSPIRAPYGYAISTGWSTSNATPNNKMGSICYQDGTTKINAIYSPAYSRPSNAYQNEFFELLISV